LKEYKHLHHGLYLEILERQNYERFKVQ
jgi:hypothetical protein